MAIKHLEHHHEVGNLRDVCIAKPPAFTSLIDYLKVNAILHPAAHMPLRLYRHRIRTFTHTKLNAVTLQLGWFFTDRRPEETIEHITAATRTTEHAIVIDSHYEVVGVDQTSRIVQRPRPASDDGDCLILKSLANLNTRQEANRLLL